MRGGRRGGWRWVRSETPTRDAVRWVILRLRRFPGSHRPIMLKRRADGPKTGRKKKKGNATYASTSLDPTDDEKQVVEDIRVWNISTSEKTGRLTASRRTLKHYHEAQPSLSEEPSTSKKLGGVDAEDTGALADTQSPKTVGKRRWKRKRVRLVKENDSVSWSFISPLLLAYPCFRQRWKSGSSTSRLT